MGRSCYCHWTCFITFCFGIRSNSGNYRLLNIRSKIYIFIYIQVLINVPLFKNVQLISRKKNSKKVPPPTLQPSTISDEHHQSIYGTGKNGPTAGSRHMMHNAPSHSNYNISSYGYDNYAIDDDMMMLDEDDLEEVDRLYDMDAVWADHDHEKLKIPTNTLPKKVRVRNND